MLHCSDSFQSNVTLGTEEEEEEEGEDEEAVLAAVDCNSTWSSCVSLGSVD